MSLLAASSVLTCTVFAEAPAIEPAKDKKDVCTYELTNPLSRDAVQPLPYKEIELKHYREAFKRNLIAQEIRLLEIRDNPDKPTFENTIVPLATIAEGTERVLNLVGSFSGVKLTKKLKAVYMQVANGHEEFLLKVKSDRKLMERVKAVEARGPLNRLTDQEKALLQSARKMFIDLPEDKVARVREIENQLRELQMGFQGNVTEEIKAFTLELNASQVASIPTIPLAIAKQEAEKRGKPGKFIFTLELPSYRVFMRFSDHRELRHKLWLAFNTRNTSGRYDTRSLISKILTLRQELGEIRAGPGKNFADFILENDNRMLKTPAEVYAYLNRSRDIYRPAATKELADFKTLAGHEIEAWDIEYYKQVWKKKILDFDEEDYRPYLQFENVLKGGFYAAERLFGVTFKPRTDVQTWHKSVLAYEVFNRAGESLGFYYFDPFPRKGKRTGAWETELVQGGQYRSEKQRPHILNVGNLTPPLDAKPALISLDDVKTIFHEMGHALHDLLSKAEYNSLFGTHVPFDSLEFPSQFFENYAFLPEVMREYAKGIPEAMIARIPEAKKVGAGLNGLERIFKMRLDMDLHTKPLNGKSIEEFENEVRDDVLALHEPGANWSASFRHVFANVYAVGMYSYDWDENLVADALVPFEEDMFDPMWSMRLHTQIFESGSTAAPEINYGRFRGQDPDPDALLKRQGFLPQR